MARLSFLLFSILVIHGARCGGEAAMSSNVMKPDSAKLDRAREAIRLWSKDRGVGRLDFEGALPADNVSPARYHFKADDGQVFSVDAVSEEVIGWSDHYEPRERSSPGAKKLPDQTVDRIAEAFAKQHYPAYEADGLQHIANHVFMRRLDNGVWDGGLSVSVRLDRCTGRVFGYMLHREREPIYISTNPKITTKEAEALALDVLKGMPALEDEGYPGALSAFIERNGGLSIRYDELGLQRLVCGLAIVTSDGPNYTQGDYIREKAGAPYIAGRVRSVDVDAMTGEVVDVDGPELEAVIPGLKKKAESLDAQERKRLTDHVTLYKRMNLWRGDKDHEEPVFTQFPPLLIDGQPYLYVRSVAALLGHKVLSESDGGIVVEGNERMEFRADSEQAKVGGKIVDFGAKSRVLFGRIYVPLEAVEKVFGVAPERNKMGNMLVFPGAGEDR